MTGTPLTFPDLRIRRSNEARRRKSVAATTMSEMKAHIMKRATEDGEFRAKLIADPRPVISAELGVSIPEGFKVQVHEDSTTAAHLVLPMTDRLTEEELAEIAAGVDVNWDTVNIS